MENVIIEDFCTKYRNFKNENPLVKKAALKNAFDAICSELYTNNLDSLKLLEISDMQDFKSFITRNLKIRRESKKLKNEYLETYNEIQAEFNEEKKERVKHGKPKWMRDGYDQRPTFLNH